MKKTHDLPLYFIFFNSKIIQMFLSWLVCTLADTLSAFLRVRVLYQLLMEKCVSTKIKVYLLN